MKLLFLVLALGFMNVQAGFAGDDEDTVTGAKDEAGESADDEAEAADDNAVTDTANLRGGYCTAGKVRMRCKLTNKGGRHGMSTYGVVCAPKGKGCPPAK